jgi:hypothetical protein
VEAAIGEVVARYQLDIDFTTIPTLAERHHLRLGWPTQPTWQVAATRGGSRQWVLLACCRSAFSRGSSSRDEGGA